MTAFAITVIRWTIVFSPVLGMAYAVAGFANLHLIAG